MSLLTSAPISALAVELLRRQLVLAGSVLRIPAGEYAGPSGGTVTISVPVPRAAREQSAPSSTITFDAVDEVSVNVSVAHLYNGALVSDEDLSLSLQNFGRQILLPAVAAVAQGAEDRLATAMNALVVDPSVTKFATSPTADDTRAVVLAARERLTSNETPAGGRWLAVAPNIATRLLSVPDFVRVDESGAQSALRDAIIGRIFGLTVVESNAITAGSAIAYHQSAFALASLAPTAPGGGADSTTANEGGLAVRHVLAFDVTRLATASVVSTFIGAARVGKAPITLATSAAADDIIDTATAHGFKVGDPVRFPTLTGGSGLTAGNLYYVIAANLAAQTFQVSTTPGGSAVNFTTDITAGTVGEARQRAIKITTT